MRLRIHYRIANFDDFFTFSALLKRRKAVWYYSVFVELMDSAISSMALWYSAGPVKV